MSTGSVFYPKVSIIIPVYNGADYMREAIDSALSQTYKNIEVIVVNDGSNDLSATRDIALSYGDRIRYFEKENGGVSSALNLGIRAMTGDYFSWLSHDDMYEPTKVENSVSYLESFDNRENLIVMCGSYYINEYSKKIRNVAERFQRNKVYSGIEVIESILNCGMLNCCCMLIPHKVFERVGMFHEGLRYNQDALMLYQIFGAGYDFVACGDSYDVMYRLHANQTSKLRRDLLLNDSYELVKIIAPVFSTKYASAHSLLFLLAKKNAIYNCSKAVNECLKIGKEHNVLSLFERQKILLWSLYGKFKFILNIIYHKVCFNRLK